MGDPRPTPLRGHAGAYWAFGSEEYVKRQRPEAQPKEKPEESATGRAVFQVTAAELPSRRQPPQRATFSDYMDNPDHN